ncbi:MAG: hypothetical protein SVM79_05660 [Chloroflexota bacterium]|nr:hypothetical protein [Chloroflexota bacterium]
MTDADDDISLSWREHGNLGLMAAMQAIPHVGGSLATLYFGRKQEFRMKRLLLVYQEVAGELEDVRAQVASIEKHNGEALRAIIETLNEKIEAEPTVEKQEFLKNYMKSTLLDPVKDNYDERKFFLEILAIMTLLECHLLAQLYERGDAITFQELRADGADQYAVVGAVGRLQSYGFAMTIPPGYTGDTVLVGYQSDPQRQTIRITEFGQLFYGFCLES